MNKIREIVGRIRSWVRTDGLLHIEPSAIIAVAGLVLAVGLVLNTLPWW